VHVRVFYFLRVRQRKDKERAASHDENIAQLPGRGFELGVFMCACASIRFLRVRQRTGGES